MSLGCPLNEARHKKQRCSSEASIKQQTEATPDGCLFEHTPLAYSSGVLLAHQTCFLCLREMVWAFQAFCLRVSNMC